MGAPDSSSFDEWYRTICASGSWDERVGSWLDLPPGVKSTGYLTGSGLAEVLDRLQLTTQSILVELGCGRAGYGLAAIGASGGQLVGIDFSAVAIAAARERAEQLQLAHRARFQVSDMAATGVATGSADAVLCVDSLHFADPISVALAEIQRVLSPGGRLVATTWEACPPQTRLVPERVRRMNISRDLAEAGFTQIEVLDRPDWAEAELRYWTAATALDPHGDPALAALKEEGDALLPLAPDLRRVLVVATTAG